MCCWAVLLLFVCFFFLSIRNEPVEDRQFLKPQDLIKVLPLVSGFTLDIPPLSVWTLVNQLLLHVRFAVKSLHTRGGCDSSPTSFFWTSCQCKRDIIITLFFFLSDGWLLTVNYWQLQMTVKHLTAYLDFIRLFFFFFFATYSIVVNNMTINQWNCNVILLQYECISVCITQILCFSLQMCFTKCQEYGTFKYIKKRRKKKL